MKRVLYLVALLYLSGCKTDYKSHISNGRHVRGLVLTKAQFGTNWPYVMDNLYLFKREKGDVYAESNDTIYAINSVASDEVDSGEFSDFQMWHRVVDNPTKEQITARQKILA